MLPRAKGAVSAFNQRGRAIDGAFVRAQLQGCDLAEKDHRESWRVHAHTIHLPNTICVCADIEALPEPHLYGIIAHEFGHLLADKQQGEHTESEADRAAERFFGISIEYRSPQRIQWLSDADIAKVKGTREENPARRSPVYGVGKEIFGTTYIHRDYESVLPVSQLNRAKETMRALDPSFQYDVVAFSDDGKVTFSRVPGFETEDTPKILEQIVVVPGKPARRIRWGSRGPVYHKKELFTP